jgi:hypothetical protein
LFELEVESYKLGGKYPVLVIAADSMSRLGEGLVRHDEAAAENEDAFEVPPAAGMPTTIECELSVPFGVNGG